MFLLTVDFDKIYTKIAEQINNKFSDADYEGLAKQIQLHSLSVTIEVFKEYELALSHQQ